MTSVSDLLRMSAREEREAALAAFITVALADGRYQEVERNCLAHLRESLGLSKRAERRLVRAARANRLHIKVPPRAEGRALMAYFALRAAAADGSIGYPESQSLIQLRQRLDLPENEFKRMLTSVLDDPSRVFGPAVPLPPAREPAWSGLAGLLRVLAAGPARPRTLRGRIQWAFLQALPPVAITYALGLYGIFSSASEINTVKHLGAAYGLLFALSTSHVFIPVLAAYSAFGKLTGTTSEDHFMRFFLTGWFGIPIFLFGLITEWFLLEWAALVLHLALSASGRRFRRVVEYGSPCFSVFLMWAIMSNVMEGRPWVVAPFIVYQIILLTGVELILDRLTGDAP